MKCLLRGGCQFDGWNQVTTERQAVTFQDMVGVGNDVIKRPTMSVVLTVFTAVSAIKKWFWQYMSNVEVFSDHKQLRQFNLVRWLYVQLRANSR